MSLPLVPVVFDRDWPLIRVVDEANELEFLVMGSSCVAGENAGVSIGSVEVASVWNIAGCEAMASERPWVNSFTWWWRYSKKALLFQRPSNMIAAVRTLARYKSMAQLVRTEWVPTLQILIPSVFAPILATVHFRKARVWAEVMREGGVFGSVNVASVWNVAG
jgi:hypothetical protein